MESFKKILKIAKINFPYPIHKKKYIFHKIDDIRPKIYKELEKLNGGIYYFYRTDKPLIGYLGSAKHFKGRVRTHFSDSVSKPDKLPKFYNYVNKYG
jgi:excinuclease UvrABC nuclease subunit